MQLWVSTVSFLICLSFVFPLCPYEHTLLHSCEGDGLWPICWCVVAWDAHWKQIWLLYLPSLEPNLKSIWLVTHAHTHWSVFCTYGVFVGDDGLCAWGWMHCVCVVCVATCVDGSLSFGARVLSMLLLHHGSESIGYSYTRLSSQVVPLCASHLYILMDTAFTTGTCMYNTII